MLRVANWVLETVPLEDRSMTPEEILVLIAKWIPASALLLIIVS